jgi:hypothetical protein
MVVAKAANQFETEQDSERKPKGREPAIVEAVGGEASEDEIEMRGGILMKFLDSFFIGTILKISSKRRKQMRNGNSQTLGNSLPIWTLSFSALHHFSIFFRLSNFTSSPFFTHFPIHWPCHSPSKFQECVMSSAPSPS